MLPKFGKFLIFGLLFYDLISQHKWLYVTSYPCPYVKYLSAKTTKYILKCWEKSIKRKSNGYQFQSHKKFIFWSTFSYMVKTSLKILWRWFLVALSEHLSLLAVQLYHVRQTIFWLCQCLYRPPYYNTNSFFQRSFSHFIMHWWLLDGLFQFINNQGFKWTSFWSFIVSCCFLILLLPNIVSSEELFRYGTSISGYV